MDSRAIQAVQVPRARPSELTERETHVQGALALLTDRRTRLVHLADQLEKRLVSVLRNDGAGQTGDDAPKPTRVSLANNICNEAEEIDAVSTRLSDILDRIEL